MSKTHGLDPAGETVTVTGSGYPETEGIYVAFCVMKPAGQRPTPCGGGVDLEGDSGASAWISSNPPSYGVGLAQPYGPGGSFQLQIRVNAVIMDGIDCRQVQCVLASFADHTHISDRHLDMLTPIFFAGDPPVAATSTTAPPVTTTPAPASVPTTPTAPVTPTTVRSQSPGVVAPTGPPAVTAPPSTATTLPSTTTTDATTPGTSVPGTKPGPTIVAATIPTGTVAPSTTIEVVTLAVESSDPPDGGGAPVWPLVAGSAVAVAGVSAGVLLPRLRKVKPA